MAPSTKEAVETGLPTQRSAAQQSNTPLRTPGGSRSEAVSLEVPVRIHGSRVIAGPGASPQSEPFSEQTTTMIVFPQGAVVRMTTTLHVGQMLVITNLKSRQDAICRVVKVRSFPNLQSYVEVEFTQPQARYWGVYFPSEGPEVGQGSMNTRPQAQAKSGVPEAAPPARAPDALVLKSSEASPRFGAEANALGAPSILSHLSAPPTPAKEDETPAVTPRNSEVALQIPVLPLPEPRTPVRAAEPQVEPLAASVETDSKGTGKTATPNVGMSAGRGFGALGVSSSFTVDDGAQSDQPLHEAFADAQIGKGFLGSRRHDGALIAGCAVVLLLAVIGGVGYFHSRGPASAGAGASAPPVEAVKQQGGSGVPQAPSPAPLSAPATGTVAAPGETNFDATSTTATPPAPAASDSRATSNDTVRAEGQPAATGSPSVGSTRKNVLNPKLMKAHPLVSLRKDDARGQAPTLDPAAIAAPQPGELLGIASSNPSVAVPAPAGPMPVGGRIRQPRLISSTRPSYPAMAKQARIEGDVVIDTMLDKEGNVSHAKVVSGPSMLQDAALDALRRWKFEPTRLDGQPVEVEMLVTIKFRL